MRVLRYRVLAVDNDEYAGCKDEVSIIRRGMGVSHVKLYSTCWIGEYKVAGGRLEEQAEDEEMAATAAEKT